MEIEPTGESKGHCDCCGSITKRVWGFVHSYAGTVATYFVSWAERRPDHGASIELILGKWGESSTPQHRYVVALDHRIIEASPQFMIVDTQDRLPSADDLVSSALKRSEVIDTPLAPQVFALVNAIWIDDPRLTEIRSWGR